MTSDPPPVVKRARARDIRGLANTIRDEDAQEILLATGLSPEQELSRQLLKPETSVFSIHYEHRILGMFGVSRVARVPANVGAPWLLASNELFDGHWRRFVREGKIWMRALSRGFTLLENYAYSGNESHIRWLKSVGFDLVELVPYGVAKQPFWRFRMRVQPNAAVISNLPVESQRVRSPTASLSLAK